MPEILPIIVNYRGGLAERHELPAYAAGESLAGIARIVELSTFYAVHEQVRHRSPDSRTFKLLTRPPQAGSFEYILELIYDPQFLAIFGGTASLAGGLASNALYDFIKYILRRTTGQGDEADTTATREAVRRHEANVEALIDAVEPSARRFHQPIGNGASNIVVINGDNNVVHFNSTTKDYVQTSRVNEDILEKVFGINSFNANSGYGRAFDRELGRSIPFQVQEAAEPDTYPILAASLSRYASGEDPWISLNYTTLEGPNNRPKKLLVYAATELLE